MNKIHRYMSIQQVAENYPQAAMIFMQYGLGCIGCQMANFETLEDVALAHGINPDVLVEELNKMLKI
ncbi:MAG: DUF1858 domain-containing protein [Methermicoccaceae archaeon]